MRTENRSPDLPLLFFLIFARACPFLSCPSLHGIPRPTPPHMPPVSVPSTLAAEQKHRPMSTSLPPCLALPSHEPVQLAAVFYLRFQHHAISLYFPPLSTRPSECRHVTHRKYKCAASSASIPIRFLCCPALGVLVKS